MPDNESEFEAQMEAMSRVYSLRAGKVLTVQDYEAIQTFDKASRDDQERAVDAFHRGYEQGLTEGGGAEVSDLKKRISDLSTSLAAERGLKTLARTDVDRLRSAIERICKADVYEGRAKVNGISLAMIDAIQKAALIAGLRELHPGETN